MLGATLDVREDGAREDGAREDRGCKDGAREGSREWLSCRYSDDSFLTLTLLGAIPGLPDTGAANTQRSSNTVFLATLATLGERDGCKLCITLEAVDAGKSGCWSDIVLDVTVTTLGARYVRSLDSDTDVVLSGTLL